MGVRDATDIALSEVCNEIYGAFNAGMNQNQCFIDATGIFDTRYSGAKDRLSNFQNYQHIIPNGGYGRLYNYYAVSDSRNIAPSGWHVPTPTEVSTLISTVGGNVSGGGNLKQVGTIHWLTPNTGATDSYQFGAVGGGQRRDGFFHIKTNAMYKTTVSDSILGLSYDRIDITTSATTAMYGDSVRLIKDDSINTGIMTDNSGYTYKTVKIGNQVWMASNLRGTKYRNGDNIPVVTDNNTWIFLTTGACCSYNNNDAWSYADNYVLPGTTVRIEINNGFDGINYYLYAQAIDTSTGSPIIVNTNVTIYFSYTYYDYGFHGTLTETYQLTIINGNIRTYDYIIDGPLVDYTPTSVSPTNYNGYTYII